MRFLQIRSACGWMSDRCCGHFGSQRGRKVSAILPIEEYEYKGLPLINGRGFKILVDSKEKADKLFAELKEQGYKPGSEFFNRWLQFEAYRKIVFRDSIY